MENPFDMAKHYYEKRFKAFMGRVFRFSAVKNVR